MKVVIKGDKIDYVKKMIESIIKNPGNMCVEFRDADANSLRIEVSRDDDDVFMGILDGLEGMGYKVGIAVDRELYIDNLIFMIAEARANGHEFIVSSTDGAGNTQVLYRFC